MKTITDGIYEEVFRYSEHFQFGNTFNETLAAHAVLERIEVGSSRISKKFMFYGEIPDEMRHIIYIFI